MSVISFTRTNAPNVMEHLGIIGKIANDYSRKTGMSQEDLFVEGLAFALETAHEYRNNRGVKFSVFVGIQARFGILNAITAKSKFDECVATANKHTKTVTRITPEDIVEERDALKGLSVPSKVIVHYLMKSPEKFLDRSQDKAKKKIKQFLIEEKDWDEETINACFAEIKQMLKQGEHDVQADYADQNRF